MTNRFHNLSSHDPNLEEFLNNLYNKSGMSGAPSPPDTQDAKKRRNKKTNHKQ